MTIPLQKDAVQTNRIRAVNSNFFIYEDAQDRVIAFRAANIVENFTPDVADESPQFSIGAFSVYRSDEAIRCVYDGARRISAIFLPTDKKGLDGKITARIENYLSDAYQLDPNALSLRGAFESFERLVLDAADFCGCLTDISHEGDGIRSLPQYGYTQNNNCEHIAISLPIITLMYRQISALRGFNFKVTLKDSLPCLIFSAKVLFPDATASPTLSDFPEYSALCELLDGEIITKAKLSSVDEATDGQERLYRFSIVICPQTVDPRGILRAPAWQSHARAIIDEIDPDLEGKY